MAYSIIKNDNVISITNGDDEFYHIIPSGFTNEEKNFIVVDGGPHFNGDSTHMSASEIFNHFGVTVSNLDVDKLKEK